jgi:hypothetical protein
MKKRMNEKNEWKHRHGIKKPLVAFLLQSSGKRWTFARLFRRIAQIFLSEKH